MDIHQIDDATLAGLEQGRRSLGKEKGALEVGGN